MAHVEALEEALRTWSGAAYADLGDHPDVLADRAALDELRATAEEDTALGLLALGEHAAVLAATEQASARHPLRWSGRGEFATGLSAPAAPQVHAARIIGSALQAPVTERRMRSRLRRKGDGDVA